MLEKRVYNLIFDLLVYGVYYFDNDCFLGFSLKVFGNSKYWFILLVILKCELFVVKVFRIIFDWLVSVDYWWLVRDGVVIGRYDFIFCLYVWLIIDNWYLLIDWELFLEFWLWMICILKWLVI